MSDPIATETAPDNDTVIARLTRNAIDLANQLDYLRHAQLTQPQRDAVRVQQIYLVHTVGRALYGGEAAR